jgi:zinc transporter ZupT
MKIIIFVTLRFILLLVLLMFYWPVYEIMPVAGFFMTVIAGAILYITAYELITYKKMFD